MKKLLIFLLFLATTAIKAQVNVRVEPAVNGQNNYEALDNTALQTLLDAASPNSTVYIYAGNCGNLSIRKPLTLIGTGYGQDELGSFINVLTLEKDPNTGTDASGSIIEGFDIYAIYGHGSNSRGNDNIQIIRNKINTIYAYGNLADPSSNWLIKKNIIYAIDGKNSPNSGLINFAISNNIIYGYIRYFYYGNIIVQNNTFSTSVPIRNSSALTINNSIFNGATEITCPDYTFANSISYGDSPAEFTECSNGSMCENNVTVTSVSPMFINVPTVGSFNLTYDFHLAEGSPALTHDDGEEIGIYGGNDPFEPEVDFDFMIKDAILNPGDNLEVIIKVGE